MDPSRTKQSTSRRSSILKAPKPRQPLQNVEFNSSSSESSPANSKLKRRVSFAEKKHVKEFCDSLEQGTVWDQTYEENDLSLSKLPNTSHMDDDKVESVTSRNEKENAYQESEHDKLKTDAGHIERHNLNQDNSNDIGTSIVLDDMDNELDLTNTVSGIISIESMLPSQKNQPKDETQYPFNPCNQGSMPNFRCPVQQRIYPTQSTTPFSVVDKENINFMYLQKIHTENEYMELTGLVSGGFPAEHGKNIVQKDIVRELFDSGHQSITGITTEGIVQQSKESSQMHSRKSQHILQQDKDLANVSMEFTTLVPSSSKLLSQCHNSILQSRQEDTESNKTQIYQNTSMELTQIIEDQNNCIPINPTNTENFPYQVNHDKTLCQNTSMEFTTAIKSVPYSTESTANTNDYLNEYEVSDKCKDDILNWQTPHTVCTESQGFEEDNRTQFLPVPMEITEAIPTNTLGARVLHKTEANKENVTKIFHNESIEITEAVPTNSYSKSVFGDKTKVFEDDPIAMTEVIPSSFLPSLTKVQPGTHDQINEQLGNKTQMFHDESIVFTEVVPSSCLPSSRRSHILNRINDSCKNATKIFHNESVDITEAVPGNNYCRPTLADKTTIFHDDPIAVTEVVPASFLSSLRKTQSDLSNQISEHHGDKTKIFHDDPITVTEVVPMSFLPSSTTTNMRELTEDVNIQNVSMEMTRPVSKLFGLHPRRKILHSEPQQIYSFEKNTQASKQTWNENCSSNIENATLDKQHFKPDDANVMGNVSMEMTKAISGVHPLIDDTVNDEGLDKQDEKTSKTINEQSIARIKFVSNETQCLGIQQNGAPILLTTANSISSKMHEGGLALHITESTAPLAESDNQHASTSQKTLLECMHLTQESKERTTCDAETELITCKNTCRQIDNEEDMEHFKPNGVDQSEIEECNLMKTFIDDNIEELEAIQPPSFVYSDHSIENSFEDEEVQKDVENRSNEDGMALEERTETLINSNDPSQDTHLPPYAAKNDNNVSMETKTFDTSNVSDVVIQEQNCSTGNIVKSNVVSEDNFKTEDFLFVQDPYLSLISRIKIEAKRDDCIWDLYQECTEKKMFGIAFMSASLIVVVCLAESDSDIAIQTTKEIKIISRLVDDSEVFISIVHKILLEKLKPAELIQQFGNSEVLSMLEYISQEVKLAMDFMFDLQKLDDRCLMDISTDRITFVSHTNKMDIILKVAINVKPFDEINPEDITISYILGSVRDNEVKKLITNIKKDYKFLRRYMNDVKAYIELMEESIIA